MNTALRIASVTFVLKSLLSKALNDDNLSDVTGVGTIVTAKSPDKIDTSSENEQSQLNLFMYHVTPNQGWRNVGLPSFNSNGDRINNPPLAVDLHYLLTSYGSQELHTDILLGYGMQALHENPVLDRKLINQFTSNLNNELQPLANAALEDQVEMITITPEILSIEDISKLWAAFATKYRPTAAYKITVVLIERKKSIKKGPPVKERNIAVQPLKKPVIENLLSQSALGESIVENQKILISYNLILKGINFYSTATKIIIDGKTLSTGDSGIDITDTQISLNLSNLKLAPLNQLPPQPLNLEAGNHNIKISQPVIMGNSQNPIIRPGIESEPYAFIISPNIESINPEILNIPVNGSKDVTINISPALYPGQKIVLLLNALSLDENNNFPAYAFDTSLLALSADTANPVIISIKKIVSGKYAVRIQVDEIESPIIYPIDSDKNHFITIQ